MIGPEVEQTMPAVRSLGPASGSSHEDKSGTSGDPSIMCEGTGLGRW